MSSDFTRFAGKTVLITGAAGFLGRHFLDLFDYINRNTLSSPVKVIAVDNYITGGQRIIQSNHIIPLWADVTTPLPVREPVHFIISAASIASPVYYKRYPLETIDATVLGTRNMLELARKQNPDTFEGFLYFSSSEIYGDPPPDKVPTTEDYWGNVSCTGPRACYDESKRLGETLCQVYHEKFGIPTKIVRPFNVYGPGMSHFDRRVVPMFTYEAMHSRPLPVFRNGEQTRTFCYIDDAMRGFFQVLLSGRPGEAYNIGSYPEISMLELAQQFEKLMDANIEFMPYPDSYPNQEPLRRVPDLTKSHDELGYKPAIALVTGLQMFINWAQKNPGYKN